MIGVTITVSYSITISVVQFHCFSVDFQVQVMRVMLFQKYS